MSLQQGIRVHLETPDGVTIKAYKHHDDSVGVRRYSAPPNAAYRLRFQFKDDFDTRGGSAVKIVIPVGHTKQVKDALDDVHVYWIDEKSLIGEHIIEDVMTWTRDKHEHTTKSPLAVPAGAPELWPLGLGQDYNFNALQGCITVFVVRGDYVDLSTTPDARILESTDPPTWFRTVSAKFPRVIRHDWFQALPAPLGNATVFEFHNEWKKASGNASELALQAKWRMEHIVSDSSVRAASKRATGIKRPRNGKETTPQALSKLTRRNLPRSSRTSCRTSISYFGESDQDDDDPPKQETPMLETPATETPVPETPAPDIKKEVIEILDDDDMVQPMFPTITDLAPSAVKEVASPQKRVLEDDEELIHIRLRGSRLKLQRRKVMLKKQDPNVNLDDDEEMIDLRLEEYEIELKLKMKQLE